MELNVSLFCSLARQSEWDGWLSDYDRGLHSFLKSVLNKGGCKRVRQSMIKIMEEVKRRGDGQRLAAFLIRAYPSVVKNRIKTKNDSDLNKVFSFYNRRILTFPQRIILCDNDQESLQHKIDSFSKDKYDVDYVIVDNCAHIEYFTSETKNMSDSIPKDDREIFRYKQKMGV